MFKRVLATIGLGATEASAIAASYAPYADAAANEIYNLLFCDNMAAFRPRNEEAAAPWQTVLFAAKPHRTEIEALAGDPTGEGRVRALAYNWLRANGATVPPGVLLGTIVEVGLPGGIDTLAAFKEGGVRYINQTGKMSIIEGVIPQTKEVLPKLMAASQTVVERLGPSQEPRQPPPTNGYVRLTFLVSDGLYFGEGPMTAMQRDALAGPVMEEATTLLLAVVKLSTN